MQHCEYTQILSEVQTSQFIIIDKRVSELYEDLNHFLEDKSVYFVSNPEESKNIEEYGKVLNYFIEEGISRNDYILVIGGGATSDLGGFVAATVLRGVSWKVIPTTLLGMIDAAIGGKVGINSPLGKNLIGQFHHPEDIFICSDFLKSLPKVEISSGQGELLKYIFLDKDIELKYSEYGLTNQVILACGKYKENIVNQDFKESGLRKLLNLGHTFGHAIEKTAGLPHGVAVFFGLRMLVDIFHPDFKKNFDQYAKFIQIEDSDYTTIEFNKFWSYLEKDKKKKNNKQMDFILIRKIGECYIETLDLDDVKKRILNNENYKHYFI